MSLETINVADLKRSATAALFQGAHAGAGISMFIVRSKPGAFVELHRHPYPETFLLLEGHGRWTVGDDVAELEPEIIVVAPPNTPHGFRNIGDEPLLVVSVHESAEVVQEDLGREPG